MAGEEEERMTRRNVHKRSVRWRVGAVALLVSGAALLVGYTSSGSSAVRAPAASPGQEQGVWDYVAYTHGRSGKANPKLAPYTIGYVNTEGGSVTPIGAQATPATKFAVRYINDHLGGIAGHPLKLSTCFVRNAEEEGLTCAQKFLNDPKIDVIVYGALTTGAESLDAANKGRKTIIAAFSVASVNETAKNVWALYTSGSFALFAWGTFGQKVLKAKTNAIIYPDAPGYTDLAQSVRRGSLAAGLQVKMVAFTPTSTDLLGALTAAGAQGADMVSPLVGPEHCVAVVKAMRQLNIDENRAVGFTSCVHPELKSQYPNGDFPKWYYGQGQSGDALLQNKAGKAWRGALTKYGLLSHARDDWWSAMFGQTLTTAQFLNDIAREKGDVSKITPQLIAAKAKALKGPLLLGGADVQCGKYPKMPATCTDGAYFTKYEGNGAFSRKNPWTPTPLALQKELGARPTK
jgi:branched-chain amino acid transport system substrate-binding protein